LAFCAQCGAPLNGVVVAFKQTPVYRYEYYWCTAAARQNNCTTKKIPRRDLETAVIATLRDFILQPANLVAAQTLLDLDQTSDQQQASTHIRDLKKRLESVQRRIRNLTEVIANKGVAALSLVAKLDQFEREQTSLQTALLGITSTDPTPPGPLVNIQDLADQVTTLLANETQLPKLRQVLHGIVHKITVERDDAERLIRGVISYYYPLETNFISIPSSPPGALTHTHKIFSTPFTTPLRIKKRSPK
jgi:hypothetical protein